MKTFIKKTVDLVVFAVCAFAFWFAILWTAIENLPE